MKGGSFKLNNHPLAYFETNPFKEDKCKLINKALNVYQHYIIVYPAQPLYNETFDSSKDKPKPFRPSNPAKLVSFIIILILANEHILRGIFKHI